MVAGELLGVRGPVTEIAAEPLYADVELALGTPSRAGRPLRAHRTGVCLRGAGRFMDGEAGRSVPGAGRFDGGVRPGEEIRLQADESHPLRFMLIAGAPFREPIVPYGPFVMNTVEEIQQALLDLRNGTFVQPMEAVSPERA